MFGNLIHALFKGKRAPVNPWGGATLEWQTPAPPPVEDFVGQPDLRRVPYEYPTEVQ